MKKFITNALDLVAGPFCFVIFLFAILCHLSSALSGIDVNGSLVFTIEMLKYSIEGIILSISTAMVLSCLLYFSISYLCLSIFVRSSNINALEYIDRQMKIVSDEMNENSFRDKILASGMNNLESFSDNIFSFLGIFFDLMAIPFISIGMFLVTFTSSLRYEGFVFIFVPSLMAIILHLSRIKIEHDIGKRCCENDGIEDYG